MLRALGRLLGDPTAAVAPTVALSLFGLIAAGGLAFDYARLAAMDTELQAAADQAALAAATQLDRKEDARERATNAISDSDDANRLAQNFTKFANDNDGVSVEIDEIKFCKAFDDSVQDTDAACDDASVTDANAVYVIVRTEARTANYALTPIVAALSGTSHAEAVAGIQSSICNVAPLMVCAPSDDFPTEDDIGKGIDLKPAPGPDAWAPGNYGLLDFGNGNNAVIAALMGHGLNGCQSAEDTDTEPGVKEVTDALNTRLDVYDTNNHNVWNNSTKTPKCNLADGTGCPAKNDRKDAVLTQTYTTSTAQTVTTAPTKNCGETGAGISYTQEFAYNSAAQGFPRDNCHISGTCAGGNIGDGTWNFANYMATNHPGIDPSVVGGDTRYAVYKWELASGAMSSQSVGPVTSSFKDRAGRRDWTVTRQCTFPQPKIGSTAYPEQKDRRLLPIIAANCDGLHGKGGGSSLSVGFRLVKVFDVFITEPSFDRSTPATSNKEIYAEVVGPAETFEGGTGFQYYARNKPYLVR